MNTILSIYTGICSIFVVATHFIVLLMTIRYLHVPWRRCIILPQSTDTLHLSTYKNFEFQNYKIIKGMRYRYINYVCTINILKFKHEFFQSQRDILFFACQDLLFSVCDEEQHRDKHLQEKKPIRPYLCLDGTEYAFDDSNIQFSFEESTQLS